MNDVIQMTEKEYKDKKRRLAEAHAQLETCMEDLKAARSFGDLSENSDYDAARDKYRDLSAEIVALNNELSNCELVHDDRTNIIKIGSTIKVTRVDDNGNALEEAREFVVARNGDTILRKVIGSTSPLGKVILGKSSGIFDIVCNGKRRFKVEKVQSEN